MTCFVVNMIKHALTTLPKVSDMITETYDHPNT